MNETVYTILIVDDDPSVRSLLSAYLASKGHTCVTAANGREAMERVGTTDFDAVITDIKMPEMDGVAFTRGLSLSLSSMPVMVMTGFTGEYSEEDAINAGAWDFIAKPFTLNEFSARFDKMMRDLKILSIMRSKEEEINRLKDMAYFDPLTGLPNRNLFCDRLAQAVELAKRNDFMLALLFMDLDHFKAVNDRWGHDIGDLLLKEVARRISVCVRKADTVARMGGDEFSALLVQIAHEEEAEYVAKRIIEILAGSIAVEECECLIGASVGISLFPSDGRDAQMLLKKADVAMYRVKTEGRNNYCFAGRGGG